MRKRSRWIALSLAVAMLAGSVLTGCGNQIEETKESTQESKQTVETSVADEVSEEPQTLTVALQAHQMVTDYEDNYLTNYIEEKLNIEIEFVMLPVAIDEAKTKVSLLLAEGKNIPDVFIGGLDNSSVQQYGQQGYFVDVSEYAYDSEKMPYLSALLEDDALRASFENSLLNPDGSIYGFNILTDQTYELLYKNMINQTWLDYLGLEVPTNLEELKEVLIAFRDGDPNQNGIQDEMPLYGTINAGVGRCTLDSIINCFTYWGGNRDHNQCLGVEDGVIYAEFTTDEYREALKYLNDLYEEKLIPDNVFTDQTADWKANSKLDPNVVGFQTANSYGDVSADEMVAIPLFDGVNGESYTIHRTNAMGAATAISADTDNLDLCLKFIDLFYEEECSIIVRFGEEDVHWTRDVDKMIEAGADAQYRDVLETYDFAVLCELWNENHNGNWRGIQNYCLGTNGYRYKWLELYDEKLEAANAELAGNKLYTLTDFENDNLANRMPEEVLPELKYTDDELSEVGELKTNINSQVWLSLTQFIKGDRDIDSDSDWNTYLAEMENIGLSRYMEMAQTAYNRMK